MKHTPPPIVDLSSVIPSLRPLARKAIRLHPRAGSAKPESSSAGAEIAWPRDEVWPTCEEHGCPYIPVMEIWQRDVPGFQFRDGSDILQVLWCPHDHKTMEPLYGPASLLFWRKAADINNRIAPPHVESANPDYLPQPCVFYPEEVTEYPCYLSLQADHPSIVDAISSSDELAAAVRRMDEPLVRDSLELYLGMLAVAEGTKLGGYPDWQDSDETPNCICGEEMDFLFVVSSSEYSGTSWKRWCPEEDQHVIGAELAERLAVQSPLGVMLGDAGTMDYFVCRACDHWPFTAVLQD